MQEQQRNRRWLILALYAITWVGGWVTYPWALQREAMRTWESVTEERRRFPDGPKTSMSFCVPVLPGVLIAWTDTRIGRLHAQAGPAVFVYYGFGSATLFHHPIVVS
jgi:hypothetical protein